jgi:hypothetical protein
MSAESEFVLQTVIHGADEETARAASVVERWDVVADLAIENRVWGFVLPALKALDRPDARAAAARLRDSLLASVAEVALLESELKGLIKDLRRARVDAIVLKGPAMARVVYPTPHLRPFDDIDIAVAAGDFGVASTVLKAEGYHAADDVSRFHAEFQRVDQRTLIELHADLLQLGIPSLCERDWWSRAEPLPGIEGALCLAPCDAVVQLAVHAHKHGYNRLIWLKDLDLLARIGDRIDWDLVVSSSLREGVEGAVWYALSMAHDLLETPLPGDLLARLAPAWPIRALYRRIWPLRRVAGLEGRSHWNAVQFQPASLRGAVPSLVLLSRRRDRGRVILEALL